MKYLSNEYRQFWREAEAAQTASQLFWGLGRNIEERKDVKQVEEEFGEGKENMIEEHHRTTQPAGEKIDG